MSRRKRIAERKKIDKAKKKGEIPLTRNEQRKKMYSQMAGGILGRMEKDKYEEMRIEVLGSYKKRGMECKHNFPCELRGETPTRKNYDLVSRLYNQLP